MHNRMDFITVACVVICNSIWVVHEGCFKDSVTQYPNHLRNLVNKRGYRYPSHMISESCLNNKVPACAIPIAFIPTPAPPSFKSMLRSPPCDYAS